ncbi:DbpA RNA binding domain-containing protein, partial [Vibrio fortis]
IEGKSVGKINLFPMRAYVAVEKSVAKKALRKIESGKMKGRQFRARILK